MVRVVLEPFAPGWVVVHAFDPVRGVPLLSVAAQWEDVPELVASLLDGSGVRMLTD